MNGERKAEPTPMRILIYGAGVIGSLYGALLAMAGFNVSVHADGESLTEFNGG